MSRNLSRTRKNCASHLVERLESRRLLCGASWDTHYDPVVELRPDLIDPKTGISPTSPTELADPADIVWTNRGQSSDGFAARFGTSAPTARAVVDAVIDYFELMIGSFNYPTAGQTYSLTLSMGASGSGFGASAGLSTSLGGKPKSGSVTMGAGNGSADANDDNGWFLDTTPYDNSEFMGNIVNAFAGDAQAGSPAFNRGDFFTVVAAELTHCMGLFGNALAGWANKTHDTGVADTAEGGGVGTFWTFNGNFIDHLLTSYDSGAGNWGSAIHGAGPGVSVTDQFGNVYWGAQDIGNAIYEYGRRYMVSNTYALMLKDAYGFSSIDPAQFGTFYSTPFSSTGVVTIRGGGGASVDNIQIFRTPGNKLTVAVDVGIDIAGTGTLPGSGNLPAFISVYDVSQVSSFSVDPQGGDDIFFLDTSDFSQGITQPISISGGSGNDTLTMTYTGGRLDYLRGAVTFDGQSGVDSIVMHDYAASFSDTYTITSNSVSRVNFGGLTYSNSESLQLTGQTGNNVFNINGTLSTMSMSLDGGPGADTFNVAASTANLDNVRGPISFNGGSGTDTAVFADYNSTQPHTYAVGATTITRPGNGAWSFIAMENRELYGGDAADWFNVSGTQAGTTTKLAGHLSGDSFIVGAGTAGASLVDGTLQLFGEEGSDYLAIDDRLFTSPATYDVTAANITRTDAAAVSYNAIESVEIIAGSAADTVRVVDQLATVSLDLTLGAGLDDVDINSDGVGTANVRLVDIVQDLASLDIFAGGTAFLTSGGTRVIDTDALTIAATGKLDLADNDLIVDYTSASQLATIQGLINTARNGGAWNGNGITSTSAQSANPKITTLGAMEATSYKSIYGAAATFANRSIDNTAVLVKYTYYGDTDFNGRVDGADYARIDATFNQESATHTNIGGWINGDCDGNGKIDGADYALIDAAFNSQGSTRRPAGGSFRGAV